MKTKLELFAFILVALAVVALRVEAQAPPQFFTIHNFNGSAGDGALPVGNLVAGPDGIILGVTQNGGTSNANNGTFFALLPAGGNSYNFTNVYNFTGGSDGGHPVGDLTMQINGQVGNLATLPIKIKPQLLFDSGTVEGETRDSSGFMGLFFFYCAGVVIDGNDKFYIEPPPPTTNPPPPLVVEQKLIQPAIVASGNTLFGVNIDASGDGGVYSMNTNGTGYTVLHFFSNYPDGYYPNYSLTLSGNTLYGTTRSGGSIAGGNYGGNGTVWKINTDGSGYAILHYFTNNPDGETPMGGVLLSGSTLYGTTYHGGDYNGTIYSINTNGSGYQVIGIFDYPQTLDDEPEGDLILSGNTLYGTAHFGGANDGGGVYSFNLNSNTFTALYSFSYPTDNGSGTLTNSDGCYPTAGVLLSGNTLVGTTPSGGIYGDGTVFEIILPSPPSLGIAKSGGSFKISWPSSATNYVLQQNSDLTTTNWSTNSLAISDDGTNKSVTIITTTGSSFFRLLNTNSP